MHCAEKVHDTTLNDENASQHVTSILVMALRNQPEAFCSDLVDDQSRYLLLLFSLLGHIALVAQRPIVIKLSCGRSVSLCVGRSVQCIVEKRRIGSGCHLAS